MEAIQSSMDPGPIHDGNESRDTKMLQTKQQKQMQHVGMVSPDFNCSSKNYQSATYNFANRNDKRDTQNLKLMSTMVSPEAATQPSSMHPASKHKTLTVVTPTIATPTATLRYQSPMTGPLKSPFVNSMALLDSKLASLKKVDNRLDDRIESMQAWLDGSVEDSFDGELLFDEWDLEEKGRMTMMGSRGVNQTKEESENIGEIIDKKVVGLEFDDSSVVADDFSGQLRLPTRANNQSLEERLVPITPMNTLPITLLPRANPTIYKPAVDVALDSDRELDKKENQSIALSRCSSPLQNEIHANDENSSVSASAAVEEELVKTNQLTGGDQCAVEVNVDGTSNSAENNSLYDSGAHVNLQTLDQRVLNMQCKIPENNDPARETVTASDEKAITNPSSKDQMANVQNVHSADNADDGNASDCAFNIGKSGLSPKIGLSLNSSHHSLLVTNIESDLPQKSHEVAFDENTISQINMSQIDAIESSSKIENLSNNIAISGTLPANRALSFSPDEVNQDQSYSTPFGRNVALQPRKQEFRKIHESNATDARRRSTGCDSDKSDCADSEHDSDEDENSGNDPNDSILLQSTSSIDDSTQFASSSVHDTLASIALPTFDTSSPSNCRDYTVTQQNPCNSPIQPKNLYNSKYVCVSSSDGEDDSVATLAEGQIICEKPTEREEQLLDLVAKLQCQLKEATGCRDIAAKGETSSLSLIPQVDIAKISLSECAQGLDLEEKLECQATQSPTATLSNGPSWITEREELLAIVAELRCKLAEATTSLDDMIEERDALKLERDRLLQANQGCMPSKSQSKALFDILDTALTSKHTPTQLDECIVGRAVESQPKADSLDFDDEDELEEAIELVIPATKSQPSALHQAPNDYLGLNADLTALRLQPHIMLNRNEEQISYLKVENESLKAQLEALTPPSLCGKPPPSSISRSKCINLETFLGMSSYENENISTPSSEQSVSSHAVQLYDLEKGFKKAIELRDGLIFLHEQLIVKHSDLECRLNTLNAEKERSISELQQASSLLSLLEASKGALMSNFDELRTEIDSLAVRLSEAESKRDAAESKLNVAEEMIQALKSQLESAEGDCNILSNQLKTAENKLTVARNENDLLVEEQNKQKEKIQELISELSMIDEEKAGLEELLENVSFTIDHIRQQIEQKEDTIVTLHESILSLKTEMSSCSVRLGDTESKLQDAIVANELNRNQVETNHCLSAALELAEQQSSLLRAVKDEKQSMQESLESTISELTARVDVLSKQLASKESEIANLREEKSSVEAHVDFLMEQGKDLVAKYEIISSENESLELSLSEKRKQLKITEECISQSTGVQEAERISEASREAELSFADGIGLLNKRARFRRIAANLSVVVLQLKLRAARANDKSRSQESEIVRLRGKLIDAELSMKELNTDRRRLVEDSVELNQKIAVVMVENETLMAKLNSCTVGSSSSNAIVLDDECGVEAVNCTAYSTTHHNEAVGNAHCIKNLQTTIASLATALVKLKVREMNTLKLMAKWEGKEILNQQTMCKFRQCLLELADQQRSMSECVLVAKNDTSTELLEFREHFNEQLMGLHSESEGLSAQYSRPLEKAEVRAVPSKTRGLDQEIVRLQSENTDLRTQNASLMDTVADLQERNMVLDMLSSKVKRPGEEIEWLQSENEDLHSQNAKVSGTIDELEQEEERSETLLSKTSNPDNQMIQLKSENGIVQANNAQLSDALVSLQITRLQTENNGLRDQNNSLMDVVAKLKQEAEMVEMEKDSSSIKNSNIESLNEIARKHSEDTIISTLVDINQDATPREPSSGTCNVCQHAKQCSSVIDEADLSTIVAFDSQNQELRDMNEQLQAMKNELVCKDEYFSHVVTCHLHKTQEDSELIAKLKSENDILREEQLSWSRGNEATSLLKAQLETVTSQKDDMEKFMTASQENMMDEINGLLGTISSLKLERDSLVGQLRDCKESAIHISQRVKSSQSESELATKLRRQLEFQLNAKAEEADFLNQRVSSQTARIEELSLQVREIAQEREREKNAMSEMNSKVLSLVSERDDLLSKLTAATDKANDLKADNEKLRQSLHSFRPSSGGSNGTDCTVKTCSSCEYVGTVCEDEETSSSERDIFDILSSPQISDQDIYIVRNKMSKLHSIISEVQGEKSLLQQEIKQLRQFKDSYEKRQHASSDLLVHSDEVERMLTKTSQSYSYLLIESQDDISRLNKELESRDQPQATNFTSPILSVSASNRPKFEISFETPRVSNAVSKSHSKPSPTPQPKSKSPRALTRVTSKERFEVKKGSSIFSMFRDTRKTGRKDKIKYREGKKDKDARSVNSSEPISPGEKRKREQAEQMRQAMRRRCEI